MCVCGAGKTAYVQSPESVSATKSDGGDLYVNDTTLKFTAPKDYSGPASITFTAADGKGNYKTQIINSAVLNLADHGHRPRSATADLLVVHDRRGGR